LMLMSTRGEPGLKSLSLGRIKGRHSPHDLVPEHQDAPSALSSQGRLARSGTALRFWCQGGLPSSLFLTSSP
jgi:hypothetical protein